MQIDQKMSKGVQDRQNLDLSANNIDYNELNEEFGDVDISDEEDLIEKENLDMVSKSKTQSKYEKHLKQGHLIVNPDKYLFQNYFISMRARAKITKQEEQEATKLLLQDPKKKATQSKKMSKSTKKKRTIVKKNYQTDIEDDDVDMEQDDYGAEAAIESSDTRLDAHVKHQFLKNKNIELLIKTKYSEMKYMLDCGFNILLYGIGSKFEFLNLFCQKHLQNQPVFVFNGFHSGCNIKKVLNEMIAYFEKELLQIQDTKGASNRQNIYFPKNTSMHEKVIQLKQQFMMLQQHNNSAELYQVPDFSEVKIQDLQNIPDLTPFTQRIQQEGEQVYIVIHSMDVGQLKSDEAQEILAELSSIKQINLLVTVDHIGVPRLWNDQQLDKLNFYCMQINTYQLQDLEFQYQPKLFSAKNDTQETGLMFVLRSMTSHQRSIIKLIAKYQLDNHEEKGIKIKHLLNLCVENMLVNNQKGLKDYLAEAKDHKVVLERLDESGYTYLFMNYTPQILEKIINDTLEQENENDE